MGINIAETMLICNIFALQYVQSMSLILQAFVFVKDVSP